MLLIKELLIVEFTNCIFWKDQAELSDACGSGQLRLFMSLGQTINSDLYT